MQKQGDDSGFGGTVWPHNTHWPLLNIPLECGQTKIQGGGGSVSLQSYYISNINQT